jgi:hypothetical protein
VVANQRGRGSHLIRYPLFPDSPACMFMSQSRDQPLHMDTRKRNPCIPQPPNMPTQVQSLVSLLSTSIHSPSTFAGHPNQASIARCGIRTPALATLHELNDLRLIPVFWSFVCPWSECEYRQSPLQGLFGSSSTAPSHKVIFDDRSKVETTHRNVDCTGKNDARPK